MNSEDQSYMNNSAGISDSFLNRFGMLVGVITTVVLAILLLVFAAHIWLILFASILVAISLRGVGKFIINLLPMDESKVSETVKVGIATILILLITSSMVLFLGPGLSSELDDFSMQVPTGLESLRTIIRDIPGASTILDALPNAEQLTDRASNISGFSANIVSRFTGVISSTLGFLLETFLIIVIGIYLAISPSLYVDNFKRLFPKPYRPRAQEVLSEIKVTLRNWVLARSASVIVVIVLTLIGLIILGMPLVLTLAIIAGILSFIPNLGPILASIPAIIIASNVSPQMILFVIILYIIVQTIESYFVTPALQQYTISLPPALIIMTQVLAALFLGFLGVFLAAPMIATTIVLVKELYIKDILGDETETLF